MDFIQQIRTYFKQHGTKVLGAIAGVMGVISTTGVVHAKYVPWVLTAAGIATFFRGFVNDKNGNP